MDKRIEWIDVQKAIDKWIKAGEPVVDFIDDPIVEENTVPYAWSSQLTHEKSEACPLKSAYDIAYKYDNSILPDGVSLEISPGLRRLFDQALHEEKRIASAIAYSHDNVLYNHRVIGIGRPDIVAQGQVLEVKFTSKEYPQYKWLYQIAAYMDALNLDFGQIVQIARSDYSMRCFKVVHQNEQFIMEIETGEFMAISELQFQDVKTDLENQFRSILQGDRPLPPFESPVLIDPIDKKPKSNHCLYVRDRDEHIYFQCHGKTLSGDRCKKTVTDNPLCDVHNKQDMSMEIEWSDPVVRAKCNCPWFSYCWTNTKYENVEVK